MPGPSRRPPSYPPSESGFFQRIVLGNIWAIVALFCLLLLVFYLFRSRKEELAQPEAPPPIVIPENALPSPIPTVTPKQAGKQELEDIREEDVTPEFVEQHTARMHRYLTVGVAGVKFSLQFEKDPRKLQEMKDRIAMGERLIKKLEAVNPKDRSTWFFMEKDQGVSKEVDRFIVPRASHLPTPSR